MSAIINFIVILCLVIIGGLPSAYLLIGMPAIIIWKIDSKFKYNLSLYD